MSLPALMKHGERECDAVRVACFSAVLARWLTILGLAAMAGCGGSYSQNDMRQYALRSAPEPEVEEPAQPAPPSAQPAERVASAEREPKPAAPPPTKTTTPSRPQSKPAAAPTAASETASDTQSPPKEPLSAEERAKRTVANLERIAAAFQKHLAELDCYPARSVSNDKEEFLSWRVHLLPYLGYQKLYDQFRLDEPWNSRANYELLKKIPAVYQSPERFDDHTNYVVLAGSSSIFNDKRPVRLSDFEDGPKNTAMIVEVDDVAAVPWTAPREYSYDPRTPNKNLGTLRGGSFFVMWGNTEVGRVLSTAPQDKLRAMFTHDAGEAFTGGEIDQPLFAAAPRGAATAASAANGGTSAAAVPSGATVAAATSALAAEYSQQSSEALTRRDEQLGVSYYYAAALAGPPGQPWVQQFKWVPALRRPAAVIRFGIGLQYDGPQENRFAANDPRSPRSSAWNSVTGELGKQLVEVLAHHAASHGNSTLLAQDPATKKKNTSPARRVNTRTLDATGLFAPGVAYLTQARESAIRRLAEREGIDLLMIVDWRETARGWSAGLSLVDVIRGAEVWKAPRILSAKIDRAKSNPLAANPLDDTLRDLVQFLDSECVFGEIPERLERRHAAARVASLAADEDADPLRAMVEMRLYQELGLVEATQLVKAYQTKLGEDPGLQLVLGSDEAKRQIFKSHMPAVPLMANNQTPPAHSADDEDD